MKSTIHCECGRDIEITDQLDADLRLIADHQAAEIERLRAIVDRLPHGVPIGVSDRDGNPIHIGDKLRFDGREWGGPMEFVVALAWGQIQHPGATSDLSNWCEIIESWDAIAAEKLQNKETS